MKLVIRTVGKKKVVLRPGETLRLGRHKKNDMVLLGGEMSRFHAQIAWDADEDCPYVEDLESANGVDVDGAPVDQRRYLAKETSYVELGGHMLICNLTGRTETSRLKEALLESSKIAGSRGVHLFSEQGANVEGTYQGVAELLRAMVFLENEERTGTLQIESKGEHFSLTFCQGRVVSAARAGKASDPAVLDAVLEHESGRFRFSRDLEPAEACLDTLPSALLEAARRTA